VTVPATSGRARDWEEAMGKEARVALLLFASACLVAVMIEWAISELQTEQQK
jgi:hypothetical protein